MNVVSPMAICELISTPVNKLDETSERHNIKPSVAKVVKSHWERRILGKCVRCGVPVKEGSCPSCDTSAQPLVESVTVLQQVDVKTVLMHRKCVKCKGEFTHTAGRVVDMLKKYGAFIPSHICPKCKKESRNPKWGNKPRMSLKRLKK